MKYSQFSYPFICECGKQFYIVQQVWGRVESLNIEHSFKCLKCTDMGKQPKDKMGNEIGISPVSSAREDFSKKLEESWGKLPIIPANAKFEFRSITPFQELIDKNYQAVRDRGFINDETDWYDFMEKLDEETHELAVEYYKMDGFPDKSKTEFTSELIDCISVLLNMAKHYNIDVIEGLKANIIKNQERAKNKQ